MARPPTSPRTANLECPLPEAWGYTYHHNRLSPTVQKLGGARIQATSLDPTWPPSCSQTGFSHLFSLVGFWYWTHFTRPCRNGANSGGLHQAAPILDPSPYEASLICRGCGLCPAQTVEGRVHVHEVRGRGAALGPPLPQAASGRERGKGKAGRCGGSGYAMSGRIWYNCHDGLASID